MRIIGVDPGTVCCGYGIVERGQRTEDRRQKMGRYEDGKIGNPNFSTSQLLNFKPSSKLIHVTSGEIRMNKHDPLPERLKLLYNSLKTVMYEYKPSHLCIEKIFYHKSIRSALALGSTRGIILLLAAENDLPVFEYNSTELKMALTGYGRAEKRQVQQMVKILLNLNASNLSEDSTDALALCICHIHSGPQSFRT
ncbi:MAG: crossover junction endodeoxyribonuclease RuvC [Nitrospirae bacterium]|nr:crossover junction endodeoxyribonuclease RuvC [Nitrospirota bacterium]